MKGQLLQMFGSFTYSFGQQFFIETEIGNFVWNDPDYGGDNTIREFAGGYADWCNHQNIPYGRDKGVKSISGYCGEDWEFVE